MIIGWNIQKERDFIDIYKRKVVGFCEEYRTDEFIMLKKELLNSI